MTGFYEDDEPVENVAAAFDQGEKGITRHLRLPSAVAGIWTYPSVVQRVVDGDTIRLDLDLGLHIWRTDNCRIAGINAPELNTDAGQQARAAAQTIVLPGATGTFVSKALDKYGRPLGDLILADGTNFGQWMLEQGHAVKYVV